MEDLALELRERVAQLVLVGEEGLSAFQDWFVPTFWDDADLSPRLRERVSQVELIISEYTSNALSWGDVSALLDVELRKPVEGEIFWASPADMESAGGDFMRPHSDRSAGVHTQRETVSA